MFHNGTTRLKNWDYSRNGWYFVTICTKYRDDWFGYVKNEKMVLSPIGEIVAHEWLKTQEIRKNIYLDEWIVMPNHLHGIIVINNPSLVGTPRLGVPTYNKFISGKNENWKPNSLGSIIKQFKSVCTKKSHRANYSGYIGFTWQSRFYDRIIRNERELNNVRLYIKNNPKNWQHDRNHSVDMI